MKQTTTQKKRENYLDNDWIEDVVFAFHNIGDCKEIEQIWDDKWQFCPVCGSQVKENNVIVHIKQ